ncbi:MAG: UDP-N-acetylmuramate dehydrogenase [Patescibacteria group bacterium]
MITSLTSDQIQTLKQTLPSVIENEPMSKHTNFRIGGPARLYVVASSSDELLSAVHAAVSCGAPWFVFGGGSNLLVSDKGFDGLMIQSANRVLEINGTSIRCEAGAITSLVARKSADAGLTGFEWAAGLPGTIGGAVFGNGGCFGGEMKDAIAKVDAYRIADGQRVSYSNIECRFGYRDSLFKHEFHVILGCELSLKAGDSAASLARISEINTARKDKQPLGDSSAGCMFKNFEYHDESQIDLLKREVDVPADMLVAKRIPAGWLVEHAGLRGERIGQTEVSTKHGNFLINHGGAIADEVAQLVSLCQMRIRDRFGVQLQTEVQFVGF